MSEAWKVVAGFEGKYEVSDLGRVRSVSRKATVANRWGTLTHRAVSGRILNPLLCTNGYVRVQLGRANAVLVHRLVAAAFCEGQTAGLEVNHKNGRRDDNRAVNLEWVTRSDNHRHSYRELDRKTHALVKPVALTGDNFLLVFPHQSALAKLLGVRPGSVASALINKHKVKGCEVSYV